MSFISKLGRVFGLGNDTFDDDNDTIVVDEKQSEIKQESVAEIPASPEESFPLPSIDAEMKECIFDGVVKVFNEALPDFLSRSVNPARQRQLLVEALDKSVDDYLNGLLLQAEKYAEAKLKVAVDSSHREAEKLKTEMAHLEQQRVNLQESQLSADRRRRALDDRVRDLEGKLATLEAEREQYQLENKSLLNKLKVADIQPGVIDEMTREIDRLKQALSEKETTPVESQTIVDTTKVDELTATIADMQEQQRMSQAMYNDMQEKYAEERRLRQETEDKLAKAQGVVDEFNAFREQLDKVEAVIRKRDERIEKLSATNRRLRDDNEVLRKSLEERHTVEEQSAVEVPAEIVNEMNAIEDDFECPDWFVADPGPGNTPLHTEDPNFGYQEPVRKPHKPESDAQLSLF